MYFAMEHTSGKMSLRVSNRLCKLAIVMRDADATEKCDLEISVTGGGFWTLYR